MTDGIIGETNYRRVYVRVKPEILSKTRGVINGNKNSKTKKESNSYLVYNSNNINYCTYGIPNPILYNNWYIDNVGSNFMVRVRATQ